MKKKGHMCDPVVEAPQQKRSRIPWLSFGLLVIWAAACSFALPGPVDHGLIAQVTTQLVYQWRSTVDHTAQVLPRFARGG
jgi:hypothetical protein